MPLFIATWADDESDRPWSRCPGQRAARRGALSVAFLPALSATAVHRLAAGVRCIVRRVRAGDGGHGGRGCGDADPDGVSRRSLRRAPIPRRRDPVDDPVDRRDGVCHRLLAGGRAGTVVGGGQFGHSPGGLRDPQRIGRSGETGPVLRLSYVYRACRVCCRTAGDGSSGIAVRLARRAAVRRPSGPSGRRGDPVAEPHPDRSGRRAAPPLGYPGFRHAAAAESLGADVFRIR
jgi:hypothetical protein